MPYESAPPSPPQALRGLRRRDCLLAALPTGAAGDSAAAETRLKVLTSHLPPYAIEGDGAQRGALVDLVERVFAQAGQPLRIGFYPWARAVLVASHSPRVAVLPLSRTADRESGFQWLLPLVLRRFGFITLTSGPRVSQLEEARQLRIGVVRGSPSDNELLSRGFESGQLVRGSGVEDLLRMLERGMVDTLYGNPVMFREQARLNGRGMQLRDGLLLDSSPMWLAASSGVLPKEIELLQGALRSLRQDGTVARIFARYQLREDGLPPPG